MIPRNHGPRPPCAGPDNAPGLRRLPISPTHPSPVPGPGRAVPQRFPACTRRDAHAVHDRAAAVFPGRPARPGMRLRPLGSGGAPNAGTEPAQPSRRRVHATPGGDPPCPDGAHGSFPGVSRRRSPAGVGRWHRPLALRPQGTGGFREVADRAAAAGGARPGAAGGRPAPAPAGRAVVRPAAPDGPSAALSRRGCRIPHPAAGQDGGPGCQQPGQASRQHLLRSSVSGRGRRPWPSVRRSCRRAPPGRGPRPR